MAVTAQLTMLIDARETLASVPATSGDGSVIRHDQYKTAEVLKASTTASPVTTVAAFSQALSAGAATIDLTALTGSNGATVNGTGLKVQALYVENTSGNATLEIDVGASNGYNLGGSANTEIHLGDDGRACFFWPEICPDIGASAKTIDLVGTGSEASKWVILMG